MAISTDDLYERDFYAWTRQQATALRRLAAERRNGPLDPARLAEEVQDMGNEQRLAVESQLERLMEHLVKLEWSVAREPRRQWMLSCLDARTHITARLTPTLRRAILPHLSKRWTNARRRAKLALMEHGEADIANLFPETCPYGTDQLLDPDWWPASRQGIES